MAKKKKPRRVVKDGVSFESFRWSGDRGDPMDGYSTIEVSISNTVVLTSTFTTGFFKGSHEKQVKQVLNQIARLKPE